MEPWSSDYFTLTLPAASLTITPVAYSVMSPVVCSLCKACNPTSAAVSLSKMATNLVHERSSSSSLRSSTDCRVDRSAQTGRGCADLGFEFFPARDGRMLHLGQLGLGRLHVTPQRGDTHIDLGIGLRLGRASFLLEVSDSRLARGDAVFGGGHELVALDVLIA